MKNRYWALGARACAMLGMVALWPAVAAASTCTQGFTEMKLQDGGTFYTTVVAYPSLDVKAAFEQYRTIASEDGYTIVSPPDYGSAHPMLVIGKVPSPHPVAITINDASSSVVLTTIVARGDRADPAEERMRLCTLVAEFDARRAGGGSARGTRETAEALERESRTALPDAIPSLRVLEPKVAFDRAAAKAALEPGNSVIRGQACALGNGQLTFASGAEVYLFPATPYLEELVRLSKKAKPGRDQVVPDPEAIATRMVAKANGRGEFQFSKMKPGRYFIMTRISALLAGSRDVYAGRVDTGYGSANVYRQESYTVGAQNELSEYVNVRKDGDVVKVTLQPPITANPFHRGLSGSLLGCHELL